MSVVSLKQLTYKGQESLEPVSILQMQDLSKKNIEWAPGWRNREKKGKETRCKQLNNFQLKKNTESLD